MSLTVGLIIIIIAGALNLAWVMIEKRLDAKPSAPNYRPDEGVDDVSLKAVPEVLKKFGATSSSALTTTMLLPQDIRSFFDHYERLCLEDVIHLDRSFLGNPYDENESFVKIGIMREEDDLLVKRSDSDANIYIVGSEDGNPKSPELFATSLTNLLAIAWYDNNRLREWESNGCKRRGDGLFGSRLFNFIMASLGGIIVLCISMIPLCLSVWFLIDSCVLSDTPRNAGIIALGVVSTMAFGVVAIWSLRSIVRTWHRSCDIIPKDCK